MKLDFDNSFFSPIAASAARGDEEEAPLDQGSLAGGTWFFFFPHNFSEASFFTIRDQFGSLSLSPTHLRIPPCTE